MPPVLLLRCSEPGGRVEAEVKRTLWNEMCHASTTGGGPPDDHECDAPRAPPPSQTARAHERLRRGPRAP
eukprot:3720368-Alexandrium_andersonii.AAC.1